MKKMQHWEFIGGRVCLDFVNSVDIRRTTKGKRIRYVAQGEMLREYRDLVNWGKEAGILSDRSASTLLGGAGRREAENAFRRALVVREAMHRIFLKVLAHRAPAPSDTAILSEEYARALRHRMLHYSDAGFQWEFRPAATEPDSMLWPVVLSGAELLVSGNLSRLRECPGRNCGWLFLDESRNGRRHWCSMRTCGNREKIRRFRRRHRP